MGNHGGKRANSGRKKYSLTDDQIDSMLKSAAFFEAKHRATIDDILVDIIYSPNSNNREKLAAIRLFKDFTAQKMHNQNGNNVQQIGPVIGLPELKPIDTKAIKIN